MPDANSSQPEDKHLLERLYADPVALLANPAPTARQLTADALFVLDANVLLAPYKIGESQFGAISTIYRRLAKDGRLFTAAHAVREYLKNRQTAVAEAYNYAEQRLSRLPELSDFSLGLMEGTDEHEQAVQHLAAMRAAIRKFKESLGKIQDRLKAWAWDDPISTLYKEVFTGDRVVSPASSHAELCRQFAFRVENNIPPGFNDANKPDSGIGDYLIWQSVLAVGVRHKQNVVLVTNDEKNDWSIRSQKTALLPAPELQSEFFTATGKHFGILGFPAFLDLQGADATVVEKAQDAQDAYDIVTVPMTAKITRAGVYDALADLDDALDGLYRSLTPGAARKLASHLLPVMNKCDTASAALSKYLASSRSPRYGGESVRVTMREIGSLRHMLKMNNLIWRITSDPSDKTEKLTRKIQSLRDRLGRMLAHESRRVSQVHQA